MKKATDPQNRDYDNPNIKHEASEDRPLGKYGRMRRAYLREYHELTYNHLCLTGELFPHLLEVQDTATARMEQIMQVLLTKNPAPDKAADQMGWVQHMNMLRAQAEETVLRSYSTMQPVSFYSVRLI